MKRTTMLAILMFGLVVWPAKVRGAISGSGTANHIPKFTNPNTLGDSSIYEAGGNVGIGTTSPERGYKLTLDGAGMCVKNAITGIKSSGDMRGGHFTASANGGICVFAEATGSQSTGISAKGTNFGVSGTTTSSNGYAGYFVGGRNYFEGNVGIGTTSPDYKLTVSTSEPNGRCVYGEAEGQYGHGGYFNATGDLGQGVRGQASGEYGHAGVFVANGTYGKGIWAKGPQYAADLQGKVIIRDYYTANPVMELGAGLDYAEGFDVSDKADIQPGSVLVIDSDNPGKLALGAKAYDSKVAGIVAGAKGQGSGVRLGAGQFDYDVALAGRVYCNVDATEMGVEAGDLLTTSATAGYAMKATDYMRAQGSILGKAMEKLEKGKKGQILVLVTLQ